MLRSLDACSAWDSTPCTVTCTTVSPTHTNSSWFAVLRVRLDTGEVWRNRLREIVTTPVPVREDKDDYEVLFKEILPKSLWNFAASDDTDSAELPFVFLKKVCCGVQVCFCTPFLLIPKDENVSNSSGVSLDARVPEADTLKLRHVYSLSAMNVVIITFMRVLPRRQRAKIFKFVRTRIYEILHISEQLPDQRTRLR